MSTNTIEPQVPSISHDGRFVVYVTDFNTATESRVDDPAAGAGPVTMHNAFMFDRVLGVTVRLTQAPAGAVSGPLACCGSAGGSSSKQIGACDHDDRLKGLCCDQKPCRMSAMNAEISGDGQKVVFIAETPFGGTSVTSPDGDLELYLHHIPTDTTHRLSYSFDASWDETFPHINYDGTAIVWETKSHYGSDISSSSDGNKDVWMTKIKFGCDDPSANNYDATADIAECCTYADAQLAPASQGVSILNLVLSVDLAAAQNHTINSDAEASCAAWHATVLSDLVCALRVPPNLITSNGAPTCEALNRMNETETITVSVAIKSQLVGDSVTPAHEIAQKAVTQLRDSRSGVWSGLATRYTLKALDGSASDAVLFTRDPADAMYQYMRGETVRVSNGLGGGKRDSKTPRVSADGRFVVYESESDEVNGNGDSPRADGIWHIYRRDLQTGAVAQVTSVDQNSGDDSKYASASADGKKVCFYSNAPSTRSEHVGSDQYHWWLAVESETDPLSFATPSSLSWSSSSGRKASSIGRCQISDDGSSIVFGVNSNLNTSAYSDDPGSSDYQLWMVPATAEASATLISGAIGNPSDASGVTSGSDCYDPTVSSNGAFVAFRCKKKQHPDGYTPGTYADDEGWLYDRAANKLSMFAIMNFDDESACAGSAISKADMFDRLQAYWGSPASVDSTMYNLTDQGVAISSQQCAFLAASGILSGVGTTGIGKEAGRTLDAFDAVDTQRSPALPLPCARRQSGDQHGRARALYHIHDQLSDGHGFRSARLTLPSDGDQRLPL